MPKPDGPDEHAANTDAKPFVERRRPGRVEYTNPHLRGEPGTRGCPDGPDSGVADGAGSPGWPVVLLALAIASWAAVGVLAWWLVVRLM
jgi:hypothetical protein